MQVLNVQKETLDEAVKCTEEAVAFTTLALDSGTDAEVLRTKRTIARRLQELQRQECELEPNDNSMYVDVCPRS